MPLTAQQLRQFAEEGYLFLPGCFSEEEVAFLREEAEQIYATNRQEVWREKTGAPRTAFTAHTYNEAFRLLGNHPRLIHPVEQLFRRWQCAFPGPPLLDFICERQGWPLGGHR